MTIIRSATPEDAAAVAEINANGWLDSYPGLMPASVLAQVEPKSEQWARAIANARDPSHFLVATNGEAITGFVSLLAQRNDALRTAGYAAEIAALYVRLAYHRQGIGRRLIGAVAQAAHQTGMAGLSVWTLSASRQSCGLYTSLGGIKIGRRDTLRDGHPVPETAFGWPA